MTGLPWGQVTGERITLRISHRKWLAYGLKISRHSVMIFKMNNLILGLHSWSRRLSLKHFNDKGRFSVFRIPSEDIYLIWKINKIFDWNIHNIATRGKSLLESRGTTFLPYWQLPLIFVWLTSKSQWALAILLEHMHKKFEINRTKIKGGCQLARKVVTYNSKSDLPLLNQVFYM